ncbi:alpha/beta hydrolase [Candidatus Parcubacteria bacterium]|nr:alpha/beta hydrolase [Patescibacteria group bacterium]MBU4309107.1 alpha/beta hydrolase [Patescibacteria group bacterium]MBU4431953.1 alpha/beta hydrolase [Patescibacteria group bacterium]MBU4577468.1 alpha/beta hydrolase [Patescibacteria group bacterium]MCG2697156.1 alpha/beta hydrolase [Candidatus Parcubacteria bacterium]
MNEFKSDRPTLFFVHGISGSSSAWKLYEEKFSNKFNILTFDLRGHGKSAKFPNLEDYAISKFAEDIFDLLSYLKIESFILVSHSFGVLVALEFMAQHMGMVEKVIFLSPNYAPNRIPIAKVIRPLFNLVGLLKILPFNPSSGEHIDYNRFKNTGDWNIPRMVADVSNTSLRVYLFGSRQSYEVDYEAIVNQINQPTLIVHGKKDSIFPVAGAISMSQKIKKSKLILLDEADHILVLNNFPEVAGAIEAFVEIK